MDTPPPEAEKPKPNHLKELRLNITAPIKMNQTIDIRTLNVFVGQNASGKSLMLKMVFALGATGATSPALNEAAQFIWDNTFVDQNFNGTVGATYERGSLDITFEDGKVINVNPVGLEQPAPVVFMASDLRTFDAMVLYLRVRSTSGEPGTGEFVSNMLKAYRLYDLTYMEQLIRRCPILITSKIVEMLETAYNFVPPPVLIEVDVDECAFYAALKDGSKKNITNYGKGHQAILNMFIGVGT